MSYGTDRKHKSKAALRRDIAERGADRVGVYGTSLFGDESAANVAELPNGATIVGPDVERDRRWYASIARKADGSIVVK